MTEERNIYKAKNNLLAWHNILIMTENTEFFERILKLKIKSPLPSVFDEDGIPYWEKEVVECWLNSLKSGS